MNSEVSVPVVGKGGAIVDGRSIGGRYRESIGEGARGGNGVMGREREEVGGVKGKSQLGRGFQEGDRRIVGKKWAMLWGEELGREEGISGNHRGRRAGTWEVGVRRESRIAIRKGRTKIGENRRGKEVGHSNAGVSGGEVAG